MDTGAVAWQQWHDGDTNTAEHVREVAKVRWLLPNQCQSTSATVRTRISSAESVPSMSSDPRAMRVRTRPVDDRGASTMRPSS